MYEEAIGALSGGSLQLLGGKAWQGTHHLSLAGVSPLPIILYLKMHPAITTVRLCLDNDEPGQLAAERIKEVLALSSPTLETVYTPPKIGKDYNQYLQLSHVKKRTKENRLSRVKRINKIGTNFDL